MNAKTPLRATSAQAVLSELEALGSESYRRILKNHGVREPVLGVKIEELKKIQKRVGTDHRLALELYDTGVYDAQYLAGLIADDVKMTRRDLQRWIDKANSHTLCGYTVAWVAAGSPHGWELATRWIDSKKGQVAVAGWSTLSGIVAVKADAELDLAALGQLLLRVAGTIHTQPDEVRYAMNGFVIAVGSYVPPLTGKALAAARQVGKVEVDMGQTACKVPDAAVYIDKVKKRGTLGKKRNTVKC